MDAWPFLFPESGYIWKSNCHAIQSDGRQAIQTLKDYYRILEVNQAASPEVIEQAYRTLARKFHPDAFPPDKRAWATARMQEINEARDVLSDPTRRAEFTRRRRNEFWRLFWREGLAGLARRWGSGM